jgi:hypothetical protein
MRHALATSIAVVAVALLVVPWLLVHAGQLLEWPGGVLARAAERLYYGPGPRLRLPLARMTTGRSRVVMPRRMR